MASSSIFESADGERRWVDQITEIFNKEVKVEIDIPVSIFRVPKTISASKPEAYVPRLIGLGPYHHFSPEIYEMERYKLAAASRVQKQFKSLDFKQLVHKLTALDQKVRACYHKYLDIQEDTLAWVMAIDGLFLLQFLHSYVEAAKNNNPSPSSSSTAYLVDSTGRKLAQNSILSDIVMLENQIPIFLLREILSIQCSSSSPDVANDLLPSMLIGFCKALSPFKLQEDLTKSEVVHERAHLLDLLYHLAVPKLEGRYETGTIDGIYIESFEEIPSLDPGNSTQIFSKLWNLLSSLNVGFVRKTITLVKKLGGLGGKIVSTVPGLSTLISSNSNKDDTKIEGDDKKTPKVEEIMIPSASNLCSVGVEFCPTAGGISTVGFDRTNRRFHLPVVTLNVNSEVIMRNLVAYEAATVSDSLVFARCTELMNGIIDTAEDAKLLREKKIIVNSLKSDADVAQLFNGMSKAVRLTNVAYIDKAIEDVNRYFHNTEKVRVYRRMKKFIYSSWQILTVIAVILFMLLMGLQSFCSAYACSRIFGTINY